MTEPNISRATISPADGDSVKHEQHLCACGSISRPRQRNCYKCHSLANKVYRVRKRVNSERMKQQIENCKIGELP